MPVERQQNLSAVKGSPGSLVVAAVARSIPLPLRPVPSRDMHKDMGLSPWESRRDLFPRRVETRASVFSLSTGMIILFIQSFRETLEKKKAAMPEEVQKVSRLVVCPTKGRNREISYRCEMKS